MAELACEITLRMQAQAPPGSLHEAIDQLSAKRTVFYQATGMVVVQSDIGHVEALAAVRARAYLTGRPVGRWPPGSWIGGSGPDGTVTPAGSPQP